VPARWGARSVLTPVSKFPDRKPRLQATVAAILALGLWLWLRGPLPAVVAIVVSSLAGLAWLAPSAYAPVHRGIECLAHATAMAVSWLLLGLVYLGIFVPLRLWRAATRNDALGFRRDPCATTYLKPLSPPRPGRFERMY
jgi:hypothetical protein